MTDPIGFAAASLLLLFIPGPTNTLLFVSGASASLKRCLLLPAAEVAGYLSAIALLMVGVGPLARAVPAFADGLKLASAAYLVLLSVMLWTRGSRLDTQLAPMKPSRIYVATILNPKSLVFGFLIVPYALDRDWIRALPYLGALALFIGFAGTCWIVAGALLGVSLGRHRLKGSIERLGAVVLLVFAVAMVVSALR